MPVPFSLKIRHSKGIKKETEIKRILLVTGLSIVKNQCRIIVYSPIIHQVEKEVYIFAENHPEYELNHYNDMLRINGIEWGAEEMQNADVSKMDEKSVIAFW